ncbi:MAG: hypothetical protein JW772_02625 [Candidatus Diapherotrites archaeon]|nr:hypothetical protein [Candidatus Diapherotrites archaeon]
MAKSRITVNPLQNKSVFETITLIACGHDSFSKLFNYKMQSTATLSGKINLLIELGIVEAREETGQRGKTLRVKSGGLAKAFLVWLQDAVKTRTSEIEALARESGELTEFRKGDLKKAFSSLKDFLNSEYGASVFRQFVHDYIDIGKTHHSLEDMYSRFFEDYLLHPENFRRLPTYKEDDIGIQDKDRKLQETFLGGFKVLSGNKPGLFHRLRARIKKKIY